MGLQGMINLMLEECDIANGKDIAEEIVAPGPPRHQAVNTPDYPGRVGMYDQGSRLRRGCGKRSGPWCATCRWWASPDRRRRQELAHRRAGAAIHPRLPRQERGHPGGRSVPPAHRRGVAGRPDPDERHQFRADLHALAGHPPVADRALRRHPRRDRRGAGGRFRPGAGGDQRHRPGGRRRWWASATFRST